MSGGGGGDRGERGVGGGGGDRGERGVGGVSKGFFECLLDCKNCKCDTRRKKGESSLNKCGGCGGWVVIESTWERWELGNGC